MFLTEYNEAEHLRMEKEESLAEGIEIGERRGLEIGEKRGLEIGERRGLEIGEKNSMTAAIQKLMKNLGLTMDAALSVLEIPPQELQKYASLVNQKQA